MNWNTPAFDELKMDAEIGSYNEDDGPSTPNSPPDRRPRSALGSSPKSEALWAPRQEELR
jgi:hypothetical protein